MEAVAMQSGRRVAAAQAIQFPTWLEFTDANFFWPLIVQILLTLVFNVLSVFYVHWYNQRGNLFHFVHTYIGTTQNMWVKHPAFIVACYILQLLLSIGAVCMFAMRTYTREVSEVGRALEVAMCSFFALHYFTQRLQAGFSPASAWTPCALIDVLTVVPVLLPFVIGLKEAQPHVQWLSLSYLRSYRALTAYQRLERTVGLGEVSELYRRLLMSFLRMVSLVICMGCTVYTLEILGEIPGCEDQFITTNMGDLSFIQITYWMFTTISTVGYGDFSPTTAPSRIFIIFCILGGVAFFGNELDAIIEVRSLIHKHKGRYVPRDRDTMHIVGTGPGVTTFSPTMEAFLNEMLDSESGETAPDVVLLSEEQYDEALIRFVRTELPPKVRRHVHFLVGSAMMPRDLARARLKQCAMAFVIPDTAAPPFVVDGQNILRAIEMKRYRPKLQLRLVLLQPESKLRAMNVGIEQENCFSAFEQKINLLAQSTRVRGFLPLVIGLLQVMTPFHYKEASQQVPDKDREWMPDYLSSLRNTTYGFLVGESLAGLSFQAAACKVYEESTGCALLIAAQHRGSLVLSFNGFLSKGQVVIAIASSREACAAFADTSSDWRVEFLSRREDGAQGIRSASTTSARVMQLSSMKQLGLTRDDNSPPAKTPRKSSRSKTCRSTSSFRPFNRAISENSNFGDYENEEVMDRLERTRVAAEAQELLADPSLVTLVVTGGSVWPQVVAFLRTLRQPFLPGHQPIIVLSAAPPPLSVAEMFESDSKTVFLVGPVLRVHNLLEAGVQQAQTVVVLSGDEPQEAPTGAPSVLMDHNTVLLANTVEQLLGGSSVRHFALYEFATTQAVRLVQHVSSGISHARPTLQTFRSTLPQQLDDVPHREDLSLRHHISRRWQRFIRPFWRIAQVARNICEDLFSNTDLADRDREDGEDGPGADSSLSGNLLLQPRFAAGQAFTLDFFGSALGHVYHFPPTIELMEALTMPARRGQNAFPWQVQCPPEWADRSFGDLLRAWLTGEDAALADAGVVEVIALYRRRGEAADGVESDTWAPAAGYNVTLPPRSTKLKKTDLVTVLAGSTFGRAMARRGLLCGAECSEAAGPWPTMQREEREPSMLSIPESQVCSGRPEGAGAAAEEPGRNGVSVTI
uniref:Ion transport domain-containing protein n=1 Tax=Alexandrium monilatum TaxID=311494 RepID=A0A7S4PV28_9DINO